MDDSRAGENAVQNELETSSHIRNQNTKQTKNSVKTPRVCAKYLGPNLNRPPMPKDGQRLAQA